MPMVALHVWVSGNVQGVGFRYSTRQEARRLDLAGWVSNLPDGRVEAWVEGEQVEVERMLSWLRRGPSHARVSEVTVEHETATGLVGFELRRV